MNPSKQNHRSIANDFMLNADRGIYVSDAIDDGLVARVTPQIMSMRRASGEPISVFIDSCGGSTFGAEVLAGLLKTPDQKGRRPWINTVVTGFACSAAANLLLQGEYIAAYPHAHIHFHRTRTEDEEITAEKARKLQKVKQRHQQIVLRLVSA
jgi:ATP-dependent protease ClpP protease subunit